VCDKNAANLFEWTVEKIAQHPCGVAANRMAAELKARGAFPGCRRKTNEIGLRKLYTSIKT
jgi:hypothetical protein